MSADLGPMVSDWPVPNVAAAVLVSGELAGETGDFGWVTPLASITKLFTAYAGLIAVEEKTLDLEQPAGRPGATVRHLLAHAAGYAFDTDDLLSDVGTRRIYSNTGFEVFADTLAASAGMPFASYLHEAVFAPLGMSSTELRGSPAHGAHSSVADVVAFVRELRSPQLVQPGSLAEATSAQYPDLAGVVPGVGRFDPNPWGLGFEIRGSKHPHWTGTGASARTFGHFGGAGTFLWVDPEIDVAAIALTDREFGPWALDVWPAFNDEVVRRFGGDRSGR